MENKENNVAQQPQAETTKKSRVKNTLKTMLILMAATTLGVWYGRKGFKGMGNDVKVGFNKVTGAVRSALPKKSEKTEVRESRNEYRGHNNHGNKNINYNN